MDVTSLIVWLFVAVSVSILIRALYRVTLHPLAAFPGPKSHAVSHLPHAISGVRGRQPYGVRDLHRQYGDVVRIAPDALSFITPDAWRDIYGHGAAHRFQRFGYAQMRTDAHSLINAPDDVHARQRSAISPAFSDRALRGQEPLILRHIHRLMQKLHEHVKDDDPIDMVRWLNYVTFDIIGDLALSAKFDCVANGTYSAWVTLLLSFFRAGSFVNNAKAFGPLFPAIMLFAPKADLRKGGEHVKLSAEKVQERLTAGECPNRADIWTYVLRQGNSERAMTNVEMELNAALILPAGTETVSTALCGAMYLLASHRRVLKKLQNILDQHFVSDTDITMTPISSLPYLHEILNEVMRMYPPFSGGIRRQAPPSGAMVSGRYVPAGVSDNVCSVFQLAAYTSASNFTDPETFLPERWLPTSDSNFPQHTRYDHRDVFEPFSVGPRNCVGKPLALLEMKLILSHILWHFDLALLDDDFNMERQRVFMFREKPPLKVRLTLRKEHSA